MDPIPHWADGDDAEVVYNILIDVIDRVNLYDGGKADTIHSHAAGDIVFTPTGTLSAVTVAGALVELDDEKLAKAGGTMTGPLFLSADPSSAYHAATKQYVDALALNLGKRGRVRAATTGNVTIATALVPGAVIDGVTLATGDLVLVRAQTAPAENGVYVVGASPARFAEYDSFDEHPGALLAVAEGSTLADTMWLCVSNGGGTLGSTAITFVQQRVSGELLAANNLSDLPNAATARVNLGVVIGTHVQAYNANLAALAGVAGAYNRVNYWTGPGALALADVAPFTLYGRTAMGVRSKPSVPRRNYVATSTWLSSTTPADNTWQTMCWAAELGLFVAVASFGTGNRVMTSPDGITWTARTNSVDNDFYGVCWSPELSLLVAVAYTGTGDRIMTSPDGINWTTRTSPADNNWRAPVWARELGLFVAISASGANRVMTSPDGINWTARAASVNNNWVNLCWAPELGLLVAIATSGTGNRVMTSPDGINWTTRTSAADNTWLGICWSPERRLLVAVGSTGAGTRVMTSPDGINWTLRTAAADNDWREVTWASELGLFVAIAETGSGNRVMYSPDGITWTAGASAANNAWRGLAWSPELGLFAACAVSGTGNRAMTSVSMFKYPYRS